MKKISILWLVLMLSACGASKTKADADPTEQKQKDTKEVLSGVQLIDREVLFGNPERASVRVSPDGKRIAYLAPSDAGVLNVFVASWDDPNAATQVTDDTKRGIRMYGWAYDQKHILYVQDQGGDENWHVYATNLETKETRDLTPKDGIQARLSAMNEQHPGKVIVAMNDRNPRFHELYEIEIETGKATRIIENKEYVGFVVDESFTPRLGIKMTATGTTEVYDVSGDEPEVFMEIPHEDSLTTNVIDTSRDGTQFYLFDSRGRDKSSLTVVEAESGETKTLYTPKNADLSGVLQNPATDEIEAVSWDYKRRDWHFFDDRVESLIGALRKVDEGDIEVTSRSLDDKHWTVAFVKDDGPLSYYKFDTETQKAEFLFTNRSALEGLPLVEMQPVVIESRDGLDLISYLTLPANVEGMRPDQPLPMVLQVHGGPWARNSWGYSSIHQWYANRGYAVLSVNFRGSTGFGKAFVNAGDMQWGRKMHDDLIDAVNWAIAEGIADPDKVAISGGSYGGYATLWSMTNTPEVFAAGVDIVGPSNLQTLLDSIPPYWQPMLELFAKRVGDPRTEEGKALLKERSPLTYVDQISKPLLIGQGANDPRVKQAESDQIVQSMQARNLPVTYVLYPDEGHGFARPQNRLSFFGVTEAFLSEHLGGRFQPLESFEGSSIYVPEGAGEVPGLQESLCAQQPERCQMPK